MAAVYLNMKRSFMVYTIENEVKSKQSQDCTFLVKNAKNGVSGEFNI